MRNLNELSLTELLTKKQSGELDIRELIAHCRQRVDEREPVIQAFEVRDDENVDAQLAALEQSAGNELLGGIPFGVKDVIDTCDLPTTWGSSIYRDHASPREAGCVAMLRHAGAVVFGKTVSTEFAFLNPGKTRNPHNINHTPGGSSQGSAAAVADHMLPFALGTQTAASVIRPASFCGIVGYKSSAGEFDLGGVCSLSQTMDSLGFFVRDARDLVALRAACLSVQSVPTVPAPKKIGFVKTPQWDLVSEPNRRMLEQTVESLRKLDIAVEEVIIGPDDDSLAAAQKTVMAYEVARSRMHEYRVHRDALSVHVRGLIEEGLETPRDHYEAALQLAADCRTELSRKLQTLDLLIAPSTPGEAPSTLENTGDPHFSRMWTVMGAPAITLPSGKGEHGLPLGIQLIGGYQQDDRLIQQAIWFQDSALNA